MPKYQVLTAIEHNGTLYIPKAENSPKFAPTAGARTGSMQVPVNSSGVIELTEQQAAIMLHGQLPLCQGVPDPVGGKEFREKKAKEDAEAAAAKAAADKAEYDEFTAFKAAKAKKTK